MTPAQTLARFGFFLVVLLPLLGIGWAWLAWRVERSWGPSALLVTWLFASITMTVLMAWRLHQQQTALGFTMAQPARLPVYQWFFPFWAVVLGAVGWRIHSRRHLPSQRFDRSLVLSSLGAFFTGFMAYFIVFIAYDIFAAS